MRIVATLLVLFAPGAIADQTYTIEVNGEPVAIIVERQIDGRSVSLPFFPGVPIVDSRKQWFMAGILNSDADFVVELEHICGAK